MNSITPSLLRSWIAILFVTCIILTAVAGCNNSENLPKTQDAINATSAEPQKPIEAPASQAAPTNEAKGDIDINNFKPIQQCFINYNFKVTLNGSKAVPVSFYVEGEYDLNQDGSSDKITVLSRGDMGDEQEVEPYIMINNIKQALYMSFTNDGEVRLIDLDSNDNFMEVAVFDEGPSGDPSYTIYRFDGQKLYRVGELDSGALTDGRGKLLPSGWISRFTPSFYSAWLEISEHSFVKKTHAVDGYLGKSYKFDGGEAFFTPSDEMPKDFSATWEKSRMFDECDIMLIDIYFSSPEDRVLNYYFVEFPDGEKGMLYFWMGD